MKFINNIQLKTTKNLETTLKNNDQQTKTRQNNLVKQHYELRLRTKIKMSVFEN